MIDKPAIYDLSAENYHRDPCPEPSLSSSIIHTLLSCSPAHARHKHPKLNPAFVPEEDEKFDLGTAAHAYKLQGETAFVLIDAPDWRTKAAKDQRDAARAVGKIPLLAHRWDDIQAMVLALDEQLLQHKDKPTPLTNGLPERTLIWREGDLWCRARADWLNAEGLVCDDLKTTAASANPEIWTRTMYGAGADIQEAWYLRGLKAVTGKDWRFRFVVVENYPPFAASVISLDPMAHTLAEKKILFALELWERCLRENSFPAYPDRTCFAELPPYEEARWLAREEASL